MGSRVSRHKPAVSAALTALLSLTVLLSAACSPSGPGEGGVNMPPRNPFGVTLDGEGLTVQQRVSLAGELAVPFFHPADVTVAGWSGDSGDADDIPAAGFGLVLRVRNNGSSGPDPVPSSPPADLGSYRRTLGEILDSCPMELLVVEGEEDSPACWSGTPEQYGVLLQAARETAHAHGVKCTNGGISSPLVVAMTWDHYRKLGMDAEAEDFMRRAASAEQRELIATEQGRSRLEFSIALGRRLLDQYVKAGADYVNFHWYVPDAAAFREAVEFLGKATGLQPVCDELGQYDDSPQAVSILLPAALELGLPYAVWFSVDSYPAVALQGPGGTWRDNGLAFLSFMQETY